MNSLYVDCHNFNFNIIHYINNHFLSSFEITISDAFPLPFLTSHNTKSKRWKYFSCVHTYKRMYLRLFSTVHSFRTFSKPLHVHRPIFTVSIHVDSSSVFAIYAYSIFRISYHRQQTHTLCELWPHARIFFCVCFRTNNNNNDDDRKQFFFRIEKRE